MATTVYNKLVRDEIPTILVNKEKEFKWHKAVDVEEYTRALKAKLQEEVGEFLEQPSIEEIADISEVLDALAHVLGHDSFAVMKVKEDKAATRGRFYNGYILESVED
jgi:predicted house-cleaning noncanonical NTP pyrophosphatase (MazG superfamily)